MSTAITGLPNVYRRVNSETTTFETKKVGFSANIGTKDYYIQRGGVISVSHPQATALVIQPFIIEIVPTEEEYLATSRISNAYELGATPGQAVRNYLEFLVDELIWLQKHEETLSDSVYEDLCLLQRYLRIV